MDAPGNLLRFPILPAQAHDMKGMAQPLSSRPKPTAMSSVPMTRICYEWRHPIENCFARIEAFRVIATRYDKTDIGYAANWRPAATFIAAR